MSKHLDFSRITPDVAVWCRTEEEDLAFRQACEERGIKWALGQKPTELCYYSENYGFRFRTDGVNLFRAMKSDQPIPYSDLLVEDKPARPRLAEILGVEEDEEWECDGGAYRIHGNRRQCLRNGDWGACAHEYTLSILIEDPSRIIRKPRFTPDELAMLRCFAAAGVEKVERSVFYEEDLTAWSGYKGARIPGTLLTQIKKGDSITLAEVLK